MKIKIKGQLSPQIQGEFTTDRARSRALNPDVDVDLEVEIEENCELIQVLYSIAEAIESK